MYRPWLYRLFHGGSPAFSSSSSFFSSFIYFSFPSEILEQGDGIKIFPSHFILESALPAGAHAGFLDYLMHMLSHAL